MDYATSKRQPRAALRALTAGTILATGLLAAPTAHAAFKVEETTIAKVHSAMRAGDLTCVELTRAYTKRIDAYDKQGPQLNAYIHRNADALKVAKELDRRAFRGKRFTPVGPLHCIPIAVKDNYDTKDMPTTGGSVAFKGSIPPQDSTMVARVRAAGALILGKANLDELARGSSGISSLGGQTRNAYDPTRVPGGSSAGTAVAVAANLATAGLATETGVSIRNPATNNNLVGIAPTRGLDSGAGILPISFTQDRGGPHGRTVADAAAMLEVVAGYDRRDPQTALSVNRGRRDYTKAVSRDELQGARIGVVEELFGSTAPEQESAALVRRAVRDVRSSGATVVPKVRIQAALDNRLPTLDPLYPNPDRSLARVLSDARTNDYEQRFALDHYLRLRGSTTPVATSAALAESGLGLPSVIRGLRNLPVSGTGDPAYIERMLRIKALQAAVEKVMADQRLDALIFPMKNQVAPVIGEEIPAAPIAGGGNVLGSITGFPSITVPAGFTKAGLPVGVEILGRPFTEFQLVGYAAAYERSSGHRRAPKTAPALR